MHRMAWHGMPQCRRGRGPISSWGLLGPRPTTASLARSPVRISDCRRTENGDGVGDKGRRGDAEGHMPLRIGRSMRAILFISSRPAAGTASVLRAFRGGWRRLETQTGLSRRSTLSTRVSNAWDQLIFKHSSQRVVFSFASRYGDRAVSLLVWSIRTI